MPFHHSRPHRRLRGPIALHLLCCALGAMLLPCALRAQQRPARVAMEFTTRRIAADAGLPQNTVNAMLLGKDGALWLATYGGLARFDGQRMTVAQTGGPDELHTPRITSLAAGPGDTLWVGTQGGGIGVLEGRGLRRVVLGGTAAPIMDEDIHSIALDQRGDLWFATERGVMRRHRDGTHQLFTVKDGLATDQVFRVVADRQGAVWVFTYLGLVRIVGDSVERVALAGEAFVYPPPATTLDAAGALVVGASTAGGAVWRWSGQKFELRWRDFLPPNDHVRAITLLRDSSIVVGTHQGAVLLLTDRGVTRIRSPLLGGSSIQQILERPTGGLWVATAADGLLELTPQPVRAFGAQVQRLPSSGTVLVDQSGARWAGLGCDGLIRELPSGVVERFNVGRCVNAMLGAGDDHLWLGTNGGLFRWSPREGMSSTPLVPGLISSLAAGPDGRLLVGGTGVVHEQTTVDGTRFVARADSLTARVIALHEDAGGRLWIGTGHGLWRQDARRSPKAVSVFVGPAVRAIHADAESGVWVGTYGAGLWFVTDSGATAITTADGLPENVVSWIGSDAHGFLWLSGNRGLHRVSRAALLNRLRGTQPRIASLSITTTAAGDPLEANGGTQPAGAWHPDGSLLVPTIVGPMVIDPARIAAAPTGPVVQVDRVSVDQDETDPSATVRVPVGARRLEVYFSAIEFDQPAGLVYEYRLMPYDDVWQPGGMGRGVYTALPPGTYTFAARAINDRGVATATPVSMTVVVEPRFTQTPAFLLLVIVLMGGTTVLVSALWSAAARRRAAVLKQEVDAAVAELKVITGLLPICAWCRKVRNDAGAWRQLEQYIEEHTDAEVTHGICEDCSHTLFKGEPSGTPTS